MKNWDSIGLQIICTEVYLILGKGFLSSNYMRKNTFIQAVTWMIVRTNTSQLIQKLMMICRSEYIENPAGIYQQKKKFISEKNSEEHPKHRNKNKRLWNREKPCTGTQGARFINELPVDVYEVIFPVINHPYPIGFFWQKTGFLMTMNWIYICQ